MKRDLEMKKFKTEGEMKSFPDPLPKEAKGVHNHQTRMTRNVKETLLKKKK